jgi:hypothetical protein
MKKCRDWGADGAIRARVCCDADRHFALSDLVAWLGKQVPFCPIDYDFEFWKICWDGVWY